LPTFPPIFGCAGVGDIFGRCPSGSHKIVIINKCAQDFPGCSFIKKYFVFSGLSDVVQGSSIKLNSLFKSSYKVFGMKYSIDSSENSALLRSNKPVVFVNGLGTYELNQLLLSLEKMKFLIIVFNLFWSM
jgi:hypothetical protein